MSGVTIDPRAIVHPGAQLGAGVSIGAYCVIGPQVEIGDGTWVGPHVVIAGNTQIGCDNRIFQFNSLGAPPQDKKYAGEPTHLIIGHRNTLREFCTVNLGTVQDGGVTRLGDDNWIMAYVHIAHDCQVGNHTIFANNTQLAGHVHVGDWVIFGGFSGVHQFVRVGAHSMTAIHTVLTQDLPPYVLAAGNPAVPKGINSEGLRRRGFSAPTIATLKRAYKTLYRCALKREEALELLQKDPAADPALGVLTAFLAVPGRGIVR
jgi:UDP-N-acetylglucosamine acyltransferase